jgi:hypothetical protein
MRWTWTDAIAIVCVVLAVSLALRGLWQPGKPREADFVIGVFRAYSLDQAWQARQFYPRLGMNLIFGYGSPLFQYYPPLTSYLTLMWHWLGLGWVAAAKAAFSVAAFLAALGAYTYARWLFSDRRAALVAGVAYGLAPYLLFCIYERGALAETVALALLPWVFWSMHHVLLPDGRRWIWVSAGLVALLMLAHNITALFALPLLFAYLVLTAWNERAWRRLPPVGAAFGLGLGLSAFYWLPALAERGYAQIDRWMLGGDAVATAYLVPLTRLVQSGLAFDYWKSWVPALPMVTALLVGIGILALPLTHRAPQRGGLFWAILVMIPLLLQLTLSRPLWESVGLIRYVQYPWRLFGLASFCAAFLGASIFVWQGLAGARGWLAAAAFSGVLVYAALNGLGESTQHWGGFSDVQVNDAVLDDLGRGNYQLHVDYQPAVMTADVSELSLPAPAGDAGNLHPLAATPQVRVVEEGPTLIQLQVNSPLTVTLRLPRIFFPGWQVRVDGQAALPQPSGPWGLLSVDLPAGDHRVMARFGETPLRLFADILSLLSLAICVAGMVAYRDSRRLLVGVSLSVVLLAALSINHQGLGQPPRRPAPYAASLEDDIQLVGYHLPRTTWRAGEVLTLQLYWIAQHTPDRNYRVFVHLVTPDDATRVAQADNAPNLGFRPTTRWAPGELIVDTQQVELGPATPPGKYRLLVGMYRPEDVTNLQIRSAPAALPGDRLDLGEITITAEPN